jgi:hypothetical protein
MKTLSIIVMVACALLYTSCEEGEHHLPAAKKYPADVAVAWINLQQKLVKKTPGFSPGVAARAFAYSGFTLYESIVPGMPGYRSLIRLLGGPSIAVSNDCKFYYWPASANASMARVTRDLFASTSAANMHTIDSLEAAFNAGFEAEVNSPEILQGSSNFGRLVATTVFEWSKTDGGHEGYKPQPDTYVPPEGPGKWIRTPPALAPAAFPYSGKNRTFTPGLTSQTQPSTYPIPLYDEDTNSSFFKMVDELYIISQNLTPAEILIVKAWATYPATIMVRHTLQTLPHN